MIRIVSVSETELELKEFPNCNHTISEPMELNVLTKTITISKSRVCKDCLEAYLNKFSTPCVICQDPILPLDPVTANLSFGSGDNERKGRAHARCAPAGCLDGVWGEGHLVPLSIIPSEE